MSLKGIINFVLNGLSIIAITYIFLINSNISTGIGISYSTAEEVEHFSLLHIANYVYAAENGDYKTVEKYLQLGISVDSLDHNRNSALMGASLNGHNRIIKLLLKHNADPTLKNSQNMNSIEFAELQERVKLKNILSNYKPFIIKRGLSSSNAN